MTALAISNVTLWFVVIGLCLALLAVVRQLGVLHERITPVGAVLASDGENARQREFVAAHRLGSFSYVVSAPLGISYQVSRLPFAALIDAQGVLRARGIVNSREHLESLFEAKRLGFASIQDYFEAAAQHQAA
jgi:hypothetical protein